ncbi:MAG TPA: DUF2188 domain-containing protein [Candidatus Paceibacterota bacterium]|nr:DUF2188 domain-containing protein [Verrucomicrobiota bacterium]HSA10629.1 DUF2188 domain-containing protein [Candidatus Paceibacterota bacterium]
MKIDQHVVQRARGWAVLGEGNQRDTVVLPTQAAAIAQARKIARRSGGDLIIHCLSGRIDSSKNSESAVRSKP